MTGSENQDMSSATWIKKKLLQNGITIWQRAIQGVRVGHPDISHPDYNGFRKSERCGYLGG